MMTSSYSAKEWRIEVALGHFLRLCVGSLGRKKAVYLFSLAMLLLAWVLLLLLVLQ